jgi:Lar family restriction alleviation protein
MTPSNEKAAGGGAVELPPCPFCGGNAHCHDFRGGAGYWQVECQDCDATTDGRKIKSDAIEVWNRRTDAESALKLQADRIAELERLHGQRAVDCLQKALTTAGITGWPAADVVGYFVNEWNLAALSKTA